MSNSHTHLRTDATNHPTRTTPIWVAHWISGGSEDRSEGEPAVVFRRRLNLLKPVSSATLFLTARGVVEAFINGVKVGDDLLAPGWTSYNNRVLYRRHDVTHLLQGRDAVLGAVVTDGWYAGRLGFGGGDRNLYGSELAVLAQLEIQYDDGSSFTVSTDANWHWTEGEIRASSLYDGVDVDLRRSLSWADPWPDSQAVRTREMADVTILEEQGAPPVRVTDQLRPTDVSFRGGDRAVVDFGQNISGRLRLRLPEDPKLVGRTITIRHAEVLEGDELALRPLREAAQKDRLTLNGSGIDWAPTGTVHGFRYVEISGWPSSVPLDEKTVVAEVVHSDLERTGWFASSHPLINRLHENIVWSMRGNSVSIPTDCPQRDERLGWTGDAQLFAPTANFLYDTSDFYRSWLRDLALEQEPDGRVPLWIPSTPVIGFPPFFAAVWGDAAVIVPWTLFESFGDSSALAEHYPSMAKWMDATTARIGTDGLWRQPFQFGDWLDPSAPPDNPGASDTDADLVSNAYLIRCCRIMAAAAHVLGDESAERRWSAIAHRVLLAWNEAFALDDGRLEGDTATTYALAITFELLQTDTDRERAGAHLAEIVRKSGHVITTGFVGTPAIADALTATGHHRDAGRLLLQLESPSWLYPVTMGATTVWERWDSLLPDGSVNPGEMTSFNHYALGAVGDWLHRVLGGLDYVCAPEARLIVNPRPIEGVDSARTRRHTPHGAISVEWTRKGADLEVTTVIPDGLAAFDGQGNALPQGQASRIYKVPDDE